MRLKFPLTFLLAMTLTLPCTVSCSAGEAASAKEQKRKAQTFKGEYQWSQGGNGELSADFRPVGDDQWKIKFRFQFNSKPYTWKGTATGSLAEGTKVSGTAKGGGGRTWEFEGLISDGMMTADHSEKRDGSLQNTGTFKISR